MPDSADAWDQDGGWKRETGHVNNMVGTDPRAANSYCRCFLLPIQLVPSTKKIDRLSWRFLGTQVERL
jgi:hypothetical protein